MQDCQTASLRDWQPAGKRMRFLLLLAACGSSVLLQAQITVNASLETDSFLVYEGIPLTVHIENNTSSPLLIGGSNATARLNIAVQNVAGHSVPSTGRLALTDTWYIPSNGSGTNQFNLVNLNVIRAADSFRARVYMTPLGDDTYASGTLIFEVVNGSELESMRFRRDNRHFRLVELNRDRQGQLLLQVADADQKTIYYTYVLDRYLRFYPPEIQRDKEGRVHTLHYRDPDVVVHCVFDRKGVGLTREYYQVTRGGQRASLVPGGANGMQVSGGTRVGN